MIVVIAGIFLNSRNHTRVWIWVTFGMGKNFHMNTICQSLGEEKCKGLPFYHSFTGCDTTSQFPGKRKKSSRAAWKAYPSVTRDFQYPAKNSLQQLDMGPTVFQTLERFTCVLYDKTTSITNVNDLRQDIYLLKES